MKAQVTVLGILMLIGVTPAHAGHSLAQAMKWSPQLKQAVASVERGMGVKCDKARSSMNTKVEGFAELEAINQVASCSKPGHPGYVLSVSYEWVQDGDLLSPGEIIEMSVKSNLNR